MKYLMRMMAMGAVLWAVAVAAQPIDFAEGRIDWIKPDHIMMGSQRYEIIYPATEKGKADAQAYGFETECRIVAPTGSYPIDYVTLIRVGYVNLARLTLQGRVVRTIEVLDLQQ